MVQQVLRREGGQVGVGSVAGAAQPRHQARAMARGHGGEHALLSDDRHR